MFIVCIAWTRPFNVLLVRFEREQKTEEEAHWKLLAFHGSMIDRRDWYPKPIMEELPWLVRNEPGAVLNQSLTQMQAWSQPEQSFS